MNIIKKQKFYLLNLLKDKNIITVFTLSIQ